MLKQVTKQWTTVARHDPIGALLAYGILAIGMLAPSFANAAPMKQYMYCYAHVQQAKERYLTAIFDTTDVRDDVLSAWQLHLERKHIVTEQKSCDAGVLVANVKSMRDLQYSMVDAIGAHIVDDDWQYSPGQVAHSEVGKLYYYCQSGTSVAGVTYFSDVFGLDAIPSADVTQLPVTPFFQFVQKQYHSPLGLAVGAPSGPTGHWCEFVGNITDTERSKKTWQDKLRAQGRQIVETGWKYGDKTAPALPVVAATSTTPTVAPANASLEPTDAKSTYFCMSTAWLAKVMYFTRRLPLDADQRDVLAAWGKWQSLNHTPGVVETQGSAACYFDATATEAQYQRYRSQAEQNRRMDSAWRLVDVD